MGKKGIVTVLGTVGCLCCSLVLSVSAMDTSLAGMGSTGGEVQTGADAGTQAGNGAQTGVEAGAQAGAGAQTGADAGVQAGNGAQAVTGQVIAGEVLDGGADAGSASDVGSASDAGSASGEGSLQPGDLSEDSELLDTSDLSDTDTSAGVSSRAEAVLSAMSLEEKVGQMLLVSPSQLADGGDWVSNMDQVLDSIQNYHIGGLIFFAQDLENTEAVRELTELVTRMDTSVGILTAADASGSLSGGLTKATADTALAVGPLSLATDGAVWCYGTVGAADETLDSLGIMLDLSAGNGTEFAVVTHALAEGSETENSSRPASMTRELVTDTLKSTFGGIVMTDSLSMAEAVQTYGGDMAVQYALQAGNDILTAPANVFNAYYGILSAVAEELVTEEQIDASAGKILVEKEKMGLLSF